MAFQALGPRPEHQWRERSAQVLQPEERWSSGRRLNLLQPTLQPLSLQTPNACDLRFCALEGQPDVGASVPAAVSCTSRGAPAPSPFWGIVLLQRLRFAALAASHARSAPGGP